MNLIIIFILGFILGVIIAAIKLCPIGDLRIDISDPTDSPLLFLELNSDITVRSIMNKKIVTFAVKNENFLPHE